MVAVLNPLFELATAAEFLTDWRILLLGVTVLLIVFVLLLRVTPSEMSEDSRYEGRCCAQKHRSQALVSLIMCLTSRGRVHQTEMQSRPRCRVT